MAGVGLPCGLAQLALLAALLWASAVPGWCDEPPLRTRRAVEIDFEALFDLQSAYMSVLRPFPNALGTAVCKAPPQHARIVTFAQSGADADELRRRFDRVLLRVKAEPGSRLDGISSIEHEVRFVRSIDLLQGQGGLGASIGHPSARGGTLGCLATDGSAQLALGNAHVYAPVSTVTYTDELLVPGPNPRADIANSVGDVVGQLRSFRPMHGYSDLVRLGIPNTVDGALVSLHNASGMRKAGKHAPFDLGEIQLWLGSSLDVWVTKHGAESGRTYGEIECVNATVEVEGIWFGGQIVVSGERFGEPGDSGSLVVTDYQGALGFESYASRPVGLLFAGTGDERLFFVNPIEEVLCCLGVAIDGANGVGAVPPPDCGCKHPRPLEPAAARPPTPTVAETLAANADTLTRSPRVLRLEQGRNEVKVYVCQQVPAELPDQIVLDNASYPVTPVIVQTHADGTPCD